MEENEFALVDVLNLVRSNKTLATLIIKNALGKEITEDDINYEYVDIGNRKQKMIVMNDELIDIVTIVETGPIKITVGNGIKLQDDAKLENYSKYHQIAFYRCLDEEDDKNFFPQKYMDYKTPKIAYIFNPNAMIELDSEQMTFDKDFLLFNKILLASSYEEIDEIIDESEVLKKIFKNEK